MLLCLCEFGLKLLIVSLQYVDLICEFLIGDLEEVPAFLRRGRSSFQQGLDSILKLFVSVDELLVCLLTFSELLLQKLDVAL